MPSWYRGDLKNQQGLNMDITPTGVESVNPISLR
ncbi:hypothetical protein EMIT0P258_20271 [Pseudomonas sp. IT-P258]